MKKIQFFIALWVSKGVQLLMRLLGRNATYLPGKVALKLCKDFLRLMTPPKTVIAITGTNGKTTVSNLVTSILKENGYTITNNSLGSNIQAGILAALMDDTTLLGKPKKDIAVLEVDERSSLLIYPYLKPDYFLCNNIMRDSIKRNAHTEFIRYIINKPLPADTKLILNGDDLIASSLGTLGQPRVHFGMTAEKPTETKPQHVQDIVYCPNCMQKLEAAYIRYNHIGRHHCPSCGFASPELDYTVSQIDWQGNTFTVEHNGQQWQFPLIHDNLVNIYNCCGVVALLHEFGLSYEQIYAGFSKAEIIKSRYEEVREGDIAIHMIMAKGQNPIACGRIYDYVAKGSGENKGVIIIADDKYDNVGNVESTCWLYDCDYAPLADPSIGQIIFGGPRCKDQLLRALLAGVDPNKMQITMNSAETSAMLSDACCKNVYLLYEMYRPEEGEVVKNALLARGKEA